MKNAKKIILLPFIALLLAGCQGGNNPTEPSKGSEPTSETSGTSETIDPNAWNGYYASINTDMGPTSLQLALHRLMINTHTTYYKYSETRTYANKADMDPSDTSKLVNYYTSKKVTSYQSREHVWPCANSNGLWGREGGQDIGEDYIGGGSDFYHVRNCNGTVNSKRQNYRFYEFKEGEVFKTADDGGTYALKYSEEMKKAEPADEWKGDIARTVVYLYVHYGMYKTDDDKDKYTGSLDLADVIYKDSSETYTDLYTRICRWNRLDPVNEQEKLRNTNVFALQGNRNPFVDYPFLMDQMFGIESN